MKVGVTLQRATALALLRLPEPILLRLCGGRRLRLDGAPLDVQTQALLRLAGLEQRPPLETLSVAGAREVFASMSRTLAVPVRSMEKTLDRTVPGPAGGIPVRVYTPRRDPVDEPVIVYFHGGGWVIGDLDTHDSFCRMLAVETGGLVVAVDYRRAPEHKFPAALDDALAAYRWVLRHAHELGGDPTRVAVAGDSSGGNLATEVCALARDADWAIPLAQVLFYPVTDLRLQSRSNHLFARGFLLTADLMRWFRDHYLSSPEECLDRRASPLLREDVRGLSRCFLATAGYDPLRDEGHEYAERLRASGVPVTYRCYEELVHGFAGLAGGISAARFAALEACRYLRHALAAGRQSPRSAGMGTQQTTGVVD